MQMKKMRKIIGDIGSIPFEEDLKKERAEYENRKRDIVIKHYIMEKYGLVPHDAGISVCSLKDTDCMVWMGKPGLLNQEELVSKLKKASEKFNNTLDIWPLKDYCSFYTQRGVELYKYKKMERHGEPVSIMPWYIKYDPFYSCYELIWIHHDKECCVDIEVRFGIDKASCEKLFGFKVEVDDSEENSPKVRAFTCGNFTSNIWQNRISGHVPGQLPYVYFYTDRSQYDEKFDTFNDLVSLINYCERKNIIEFVE